MSQAPAQLFEPLTETPARRHRRLPVLIGILLPVAAPIAVAGWYYASLSQAGVEVGFPLDDSWIHAQYARTLVEGRPFEYVPGQRSIGTTSVLFDVVWAAATRLSGEYVLTIHVLNTLLTVATGLALMALLVTYEVPAWLAAAGAALVVAGHPFGWSSLSGMETSLAAFLTVSTVLAHVRWRRAGVRKGAAAPVLAALAAMARPENLVLLPLAELDGLITRWRTPRELRSPRPLGRLAVRLAAFALMMAPYVALNYGVHGSPVPNTFSAKVGNLSPIQTIESEGAAGLLTIAGKSYQTVLDGLYFIAEEDNPLLLYLAPLGLLACLAAAPSPTGQPRSWLPLLVFVGGCMATGAVTLGQYWPGQYQRYLIQWIPLALLYGVIGVQVAGRIAGRLAGRAERPAFAVTALALIALDATVIVHLHRPLLRGGDDLPPPPGQLDLFVRSVKNINEMQVELGRWVDKNTPEDAVIATNDIGAIAFFGHRPIVDTIGLIDPEVVRRRRGPHPTEDLITYLQMRQVDYALLFPLWHADLILDPRFQPIKRVVLEDNYICGDDRMIVCETAWDPAQRSAREPAWMEEERNNCRMELGKMK